MVDKSRSRQNDEGGQYNIQAGIFGIYNLRERAAER